ncbi:antiviral reverse transcriptase Drt3b [Pseudomonas oryzihabitans]|uniref:antiviral reverse transcriptase Drt3b n=1 Tax=Pseudomonas oryzihabitans TaxID=47885 RepID=UPI00135D15AD|nr:antiviral reverse transcriptase Drt3b [Pseudomonas oryzihabitans]MXS19261.1 hypothetical protein [Pseudomonas oryzihabitans]
MHDKGKYLRIRKDDINRIVTSETLPAETPLAFSNDGFYINLKNPSPHHITKFLIDNLIANQEIKITIPYKYKIKKNSNELRTLGLMHPGAQYQFIDFYKKYNHTICHYCTGSAFSIRAPYKPASLLYFPNPLDHIQQYREPNTSTAETDESIKHYSTFFTYRGHDRLHKFYNSKDFTDLEKDFSILWTLDVSKCFDSIYTHSIEWATKSKRIAKQNFKISTTFGQRFDVLIRSANYNETNGVLIGPEISRIFAEIIFQDIDQQVESKLEIIGHINGKEYAVRRYVDDFFIFAKSENIANTVRDIFIDALAGFNLQANISKCLKLTRPFFSAKSRVVYQVNHAVNEFCERFLSKHGNSNLLPETIYSKQKLSKSLIDNIKSICSQNEVGYDAISSYIVSAIHERIKKLINTKEIDPSTNERNYLDALVVLIETQMFFYSVSAAVNSSYKVSSSIILASRFAKAHIPRVSDSFSQRAYELILQLLTGDLAQFKTNVRNFVFLEALNAVIASSELGTKYRFPEKILEELLCDGSSYYDITTCLFYIKDDENYKSIRKLALKNIEGSIQSLDDIKMNSEKAHLFLDIVACPYLNTKTRYKFMQRLYKTLGSPAPSEQELNDFLNGPSNCYWFTNWKETNLLKLLEKKELQKSY